MDTQPGGQPQPVPAIADASFTLRFGFGHWVWNPHWHQDARLVFTFASDVDPDTHMGVDVFAVRRLLANWIRDNLAARIILGPDDPYTPGTLLNPDADDIVSPTVESVRWDKTPTLEVVALRVAAAAAAALADIDPTGRPVRLEFSESDDASIAVTFPVPEYAPAQRRPT